MTTPANNDQSPWDRLVSIIARLRGPGGCPWDREQTHQSIKYCLVEETAEFFEALDSDNKAHQCEELGDVLMQVVLQAQIAADNGNYAIDDVITGIADKLVRRHPHVFGSEKVENSAHVLRNWDKIKATEKKATDTPRSAVDGVPPGLSSLLKAEKIQHKAAKVGFDWKDLDPVLDKVEEEFAEFRHELSQGSITDAQGELGDILFALVNVARHKGICAEEALRTTIAKFDRRFRYVEEAFRKQNIPMEQATLEEMDRYWDECKRNETGAA